MIHIKNIKFIALLGFLILIGSHQAMAQSENKFIRKGNDSFEKGDYQKAEIDYRKALEKNQSSLKGEFNLGGAMYQQKNFEESVKKFESLTGENLPPEQKAGSYHNLGNSLMGLQKYDEAINAYKNALRLNPNDQDSKYNLEYARRKLQQQQQEQQKQDQNQDKKDQEDQDKKQDQKDQQKQDQQKQDQKEDQQKQDQQKQDQQQNNQEQQQQAQPKQISKEEAERMLQALKDNEKKTLEKIKLEKLKSAKKVKSEKDW